MTTYVYRVDPLRYVSSFNLERLLKELRKLSKKVNSFWFKHVVCKWASTRPSGICVMLYDQAGREDWSFVLTDLFKTWEKFSGVDAYPVPSTNLNVSPIGAFKKEPRWEGEYGQLRRELLQHCIDTLEAELEARREKS